MRISKKTAKSQSIWTGKINIITVISLISLILVDMYMWIVLKISCKPIVVYTVEVIIIVFAISLFSYNQRTNKYLFKIIKLWTSFITFLLGVYFKDIFESIIELIKIYPVRLFNTNTPLTVFLYFNYITCYYRNNRIYNITFTVYFVEWIQIGIK